MLPSSVEGYVHHSLIDSAIIKSCLNCECAKKVTLRVEVSEYINGGPTSAKAILCTKFKSLPPPEVIVYSCGDPWEFSIPF